MDIIHHNQAFDIDAFFAGLKSSYIGIDADDYSIFQTQGDEIHTFVGESDSDDRVLDAIDKAIGCDKAKEIIPNATAVMLIILRSKKSNKPLSTAEMQNISMAFEGFKEETNVFWSVSDDDSLGDTIKMAVLVNIRK